MPKLTPGNRLYLYRLLSEELGQGRQTLLADAESALADDDIDLAACDYADAREMIEDLSEFVEVVVFHRGNTYVVVHAHEDYDAQLAALDQAEQDKANKAPAPAGGVKSKTKGPRTKSKSTQYASAKLVRPSKPGVKQERRSNKKAQSEAQAQAQVETPVLSGPAAQAETAEMAATIESVEAAVPEEPIGADAAAAQAEFAELAAEITQAEVAVEDEDGACAGAETIAEGKAELVPDHVTVLIPDHVYELEDVNEVAAPTPVRPASAPGYQRTRTVSRQAAPVTHMDSRLAVPESQPLPDPLLGFPQSFGQEVYCRQAPLTILSQILPMGCDVLRVLDEDWRAARGSGSYKGSRSRATFPLRYLRPDGSPVEVTIQRVPAKASGRTWELVEVDGDDGTRGLHKVAETPQGAPRADEGAWSDLIPQTDGRALADLVPQTDEGAWSDLAPLAALPCFEPEPAVSPLRDLASFAVFPSLEETRRQLAALAVPETWDLPGTPAGSLAALHEYLALTLHRVRAQGRLAVSADGSQAAFDSGLFTPAADPIYLCFEAHEGDIPWKFASFAATPQAVECLARTLGSLPVPATYVEGLADETVPPAAEVALAPDLAQAAGQALEPALTRALRLVRANHRLATAAYDPAGDQPMLLVPLTLEGQTGPDHALALEGQAGPDHALALARTGETSYTATAVLSLARAYACARVVSADQPSWLAKSLA